MGQIEGQGRALMGTPEGLDLGAAGVAPGRQARWEWSCREGWGVARGGEGGRDPPKGFICALCSSGTVLTQCGLQ